MLTKRENFLETIRKDGKPDRLVNHYEAFSIMMGDPISKAVRGVRYKGMEPMKDGWGVTYFWPEDQAAAMPDHSAGKTVLTDITRWKEMVKVPDLSACADPALWTEFLERAAAVDRNDTFLTGFMPGGLFEQLHYLMGFEDTLVNFLEEPEAMQELCECIGNFRLEYLKLLIERLQPDAILFHDDWGAKNSLFMSPTVWREFLKPQYAKLYGYAREKGVFVVHHADSFLEPVVQDMAEIGIQVWQGVLPENDVLRLQKELDGKMALMGGIDASVVDRPDVTEEEIRAEVRRACETYVPGGCFIPGLTYGSPDCLYPEVMPILKDEIDRCSERMMG